MNTKSPRKYSTRACNSPSGKQHSVAKNLTPVRKNLDKKTPTKAEKLKALARAREWKENELGKGAKKVPIPPAPEVIIIDDDEEEKKNVIIIDDEEEEGPKDPHNCKSTCEKCESLCKRLVDLIVDETEEQRAASNGDNQTENDDEFHDAVEDLSSIQQSDAGDGVDDGSVKENAEINGLDPDGTSYSTFLTKPDP